LRRGGRYRPGVAALVVGRIQHEHDTTPGYIRVSTRNVLAALASRLPTSDPARGGAFVAVHDARRDYDSQGAVPWREFVHHSAGVPVWHYKEELFADRFVRLHCSFRWVRDCVCSRFSLGSRMKPPNLKGCIAAERSGASK
jgi:hypothetical protein